ncbi:MAG: 2-C-methyl-D-erythritol 4-phosphate cytidylyltransferase [Chloroflexi bacterium]|jgi:2-C-methyl-D-erythritol 4-phosphate cytidylyltransferase|nr:2-C-methyl-D-erythritol 4-phosphate cytidylyltransferase [Chloroflexota bacterium]MBT7081156.1 2-C-methyl-D-erythritol 4-phosphate cytidylyltransferase [Chloroflexota bacterium]MBT7290743.1 2-C-methyl-D-erythritol 4-phosphate cytidylyltransferase [Chloroflexota bacterium]
MNVKTGAIIVAAGSSQRMGQVDKIFASISRKPLLYHTLSAFAKCSSVDSIVLVLSEHNLKRGRSLVKRYGFSEVAQICEGGPRRQDSVKLGLDHLANCDFILIHDGARPLITPSLIDEAITTAKEHGTSVAAVPVKNTIKVADDGGFVVKTLERENLWDVQTPQVFKYDIIAQAYSKVSENVTDDAALVERTGKSIKLYMGSYDNIKVTTVEDIHLARLILSNRGK